MLSSQEVQETVNKKYIGIALLRVLERAIAVVIVGLAYLAAKLLLGYMGVI